MRREFGRALVALVMCGAATACRQSPEDRARHTVARAREEASVRQMPTVERVTTPTDSGRILYDPPPDLSASSPGRAGVAINGVDTVSRKPDSARALPHIAHPTT